MDEALLASRAARAYERRRVQIGALRALSVAPVAALAFLQCTTAGPTVVALAALLGVVGVTGWRGQDLGRGATAGLAPGLAPFLVPLLSQATGVFCNATVCAVLPATCVAGGVLGGIALGAVHPGPRRSALQFWAGAVAVTLAAGAVGCIQAGLLGLLGMAAGLAAGSIPVIVVRRALSPAR